MEEAVYVDFNTLSESKYVDKMFPEDTKIISCEYSSEKDYTAVLRLRCKSKDEFKVWLADFEKKSSNRFRVLRTIPRVGQRVLYKGIYRCHRNTYPNSHRLRIQPQKRMRKHTGCSAQLHVTILSDTEGLKNPSRDALLPDYPTIIRIINKHNHDLRMPVAARLKNSNKTSRKRRKTLSEDIEGGDLNYFEPDISFNTSEEDSDIEYLDNESKTEWRKIVERLENMNETLKEKFQKNPTDFSLAIDSMLSKFECMETDADLLSAMNNFGKDQIETVASRNCQETRRPVIHTFTPEKGNNERKSASFPFVAKKTAVAPTIVPSYLFFRKQVKQEEE